MRHKIVRGLLQFIATSLLFSQSVLCRANSYGPIDVITPSQKSEIWLNPGLYSYHFDQQQNFNSINYGFGAEYRFSTVASVTAGTFRNSNYRQSNYIGMYWQPIAIGPVKIGFVAGAFNGYVDTNDGGWFPAALPAFTIEGDRVGLNLMVIPTIPNRVAGSLSFQLKIKVFD
jgi:hypothetical protein